MFTKLKRRFLLTLRLYSATLRKESIRAVRKHTVKICRILLSGNTDTFGISSPLALENKEHQSSSRVSGSRYERVDIPSSSKASVGIFSLWDTGRRMAHIHF